MGYTENKSVSRSVSKREPRSPFRPLSPIPSPLSPALFLLCLLLLVAACGQEQKTQQKKSLPVLSDAPEDHGHAPLHGGMIRSTPEHRHLEIYLARDGRIEVYPLDDVVNPMSARGFSGSIQIEEGEESRSYPLAYRSTDEFDLLAAKAPPFSRDELVATVEIQREGVFWRARFRYNVKANDEVARHDHSPQYGGQVGMAGEYHLEVLRAGPGEYRVYLTDARRAPLSAALAKEAKLLVEPDAPAPEALSLAPNETEAYLWAKGRARPGAASVPVKVELLFAGEPVSMEFLLPASVTGEKRKGE